MNISYHKRWLETWLKDAVRQEPVVIVTGARQVGKSTLIKHALPGWQYYNLDDFETLGLADRDPAKLLSHSHVVIDEAQRVPKLLSVIKQAVDESKRTRRIVLSGSANILLMQKVTESLAGRAVICHLRPFTWGEFNESPVQDTIDSLLKGLPPHQRISKSNIGEERIIEGWLPVVMLERSGASVWRWLEGYVTSYLERDLRQLSQIDALPDFRRLMQALAVRSGQILNKAEVCRDIALKEPTAHRYTNILDASLLLERLPAYAVSKTKRLIKAPKPYFFDSGLAAFLAGVSEKKSNERFWGSLVETAVLHHLRAWCELQLPKACVYYWRTTSGAEVDFVIERGRDLLPIEVKATSEPRYSHAESLRTFLDEYPSAKAGAVVHLGDGFKQLDERIYAVPFHALV
jgi:predicted AAA+ superfamily ATPase